MRKKVFSFITTLVMLCAFVGVMPNMKVGAYSSSQAIDYARKYWNNYNPAYTNYNGVGGDCANFVSQCLYAGGLPQDGTWKPGSAAWINCASQISYFRSMGYDVKDYATASDIKPGNPVYYYNGNTMAHTAICVGYDKNGTPLVAAHNKNHWEYEWTLGGSKYWGGSTRRVTIYMPGERKRIDTPIDNSYPVPWSGQPKATSGLITVYNLYGVPYPTSVHNIAYNDNCTVHEVYGSGFCKVTYPVSGGYHTEYAKTSDFPILPNPDPINQPIDNSYNVPWSGQPKATSGKITVYNVYGVPYDTSVHYIAYNDNCTVHEVYGSGFCKVTYPISGGTHTEYAKTSDFAFDSIILPGVIDPSYATVIPTNVTADHKINTYDQYGHVESNRYIDPGDNCYIEAVYTNGFVKVKYPTPSGDRWSYAKASDFPIPIPHEHSYGSWTTVKSATCTSDGQESRTCSGCGESETRTIAALGHKYTAKVIAPTFTEQGYDLHTCSVCGDSYKDNYTPVKIKGDMDNDSSVGKSDVELIQKHLAKSHKLTPEQLLAADINSDGKVDVFDVIILKRRILKMTAEASGINNITARADYLYNLTWTAQKSFDGYINSKGLLTKSYEKGETYRIPYGMPVNGGKFIGYNISPEAFIEATRSADDPFYSKRATYNTTDSNYYSMDCSTFVSWCWNLPNRQTCSSLMNVGIEELGKCTKENIDKIQQGDAINLPDSHIVLVSRVYSNGTYEITEETPPEIKRSVYSKDELANKYNSYIICRYKYRDDVTPPTGERIDISIDNSYAVPWNGQPKATSGKITVYNVYGVPYDTSVHYIAYDDNCTVHEVYDSGFCKVTYPISGGTHTEYAKTSDFEFISDPIILPGEIDLSYATPTNVIADCKINTYDQYGHVELDRYIDQGDNCYIEAVYTNGFVKVKYPTPSGDRWAYAKVSQYGNLI